jgi:hypothetical protein
MRDTQCRFPTEVREGDHLHNFVSDGSNLKNGRRHEVLPALVASQLRRTLGSLKQLRLVLVILDQLSDLENREQES